jgi:DNA-binding IclR family transcriptional regulator
MNSTEQALPDGDESGDRYNVPALERGLRVLGEFSRDTRTLTAPELARRFKLPRSTVFRLLATLESLGFVERDAGAREYRLGLAVLRLGFEYLASLPLNELGHPLLERLSKDTGHACNLIVRDGRSIVYVSRVSPPSPFVSAVSVGTRLPAHATVLGRVLMADLTLPELRAVPRKPARVVLAQHPAHGDRAVRPGAGDRQRGYAVSEGFFEANISTIAAPVRDHSARVVAALGMTLNASRIEADQMQTLVAQVRAAADRLSGLLNYAPRQGGANLVALHPEGAR